MSEKDTSHITKISNISEQDINRLLMEKYGREKVEEYRNNYFKAINFEKTKFKSPMPFTLTVELVNRCNLNCIMCFTENHKTQKFTVNIEQFKELIKQAEKIGIPSILIGSGSEGLIYKEIKNIIKIVNESKIMDFFLITNGTLLTPELSRYIIENGVTRLLISLDAVTEDTFEKIRGKRLLGLIEHNIENFLKIRKELNKSFPILRLSFCVQDLNRHEQKRFVKKWKDKVDYLDFQVLSDFSYVGKLLKEKDSNKSKSSDTPFCHYPFSYLSIWSNGDISPCCVFYGKNIVLGNIKENTLEEVWKGKKLKALQNEFIEGKVNRTCELCMKKRENLISDGLKSF